jgi:hypothetical protein
MTASDQVLTVSSETWQFCRQRHPLTFTIQSRTEVVRQTGQLGTRGERLVRSLLYSDFVTAVTIQPQQLDVATDAADYQLERVSVEVARRVVDAADPEVELSIDFQLQANA